MKSQIVIKQGTGLVSKHQFITYFLSLASFGGEWLMASATLERPEQNPIEKLVTSVYPPFAMLAGMQLDLFTPLINGPMNAEQIAETLGVECAKLKPLLYALVVADLLNVEGDFSAIPTQPIVFW